MGLFGNKQLKDVEQIVIQKMINSDLLDHVIDGLVNNPEYQWLSVGTHGDSGWRKVIVLPAGIVFEKPRAYQNRNKNNYVGLDGHYPTRIPSDTRKSRFEQRLSEKKEP